MEEPLQWHRLGIGKLGEGCRWGPGSWCLSKAPWALWTEPWPVSTESDYSYALDYIYSITSIFGPLVATTILTNWSKFCWRLSRQTLEQSSVLVSSSSTHDTFHFMFWLSVFCCLDASHCSCTINILLKCLCPSMFLYFTEPCKNSYALKTAFSACEKKCWNCTLGARQLQSKTNKKVQPTCSPHFSVIINVQIHGWHSSRN